jgi:hypothetical protein
VRKRGPFGDPYKSYMEVFILEDDRNPNERRFALRLPIKVYELVARDARRQDRSVSAQVRFILAEHYRQRGDLKDEEQSSVDGK